MSSPAQQIITGLLIIALAAMIDAWGQLALLDRWPISSWPAWLFTWDTHFAVVDPWHVYQGAGLQLYAIGLTLVIVAVWPRFGAWSLVAHLPIAYLYFYQLRNICMEV